MRLNNNGTELNVTIVGYQVPEETEVHEDSDWLLVRLTLKLPALQWEIIDPSLTVVELTWLRDWLSEAARNAAFFAGWRAVQTPLTTREFFTEPNLSFELQSNNDESFPFIFRIYVAAESLPPFATQLRHVPDDGDPDEVWLDFRASGDDLLRMATELTADLQRFPSRSSDSRRPLAQGAPL